MEEIKPKIVKREVPVVVTVQAQRILGFTSYSVEDFLDWSLTDNKISLGGNNVALFLEKMWERQNTKKDD